MNKILSLFICIFITFNISAQTEENIYIHQVGEYTVYLLSEGQGLGKEDILLNVNSEMRKASIPEGTFPNATNSFLIKKPDGGFILVDTGYGRNLFNNLDRLGVNPENIQTILLTHTHGDHTGGLLKDGKMAFPNAAIFLSTQEGRFWMQNEDPKLETVFEEYIIQFFSYTDLDEVDLSSSSPILYIGAPGHTPGHTLFLLQSNGERLLIWGDLTHAMAIQMPYPEVAVSYDLNPETAVKSRLAALEFASKNNIPVAGMHLPYPAIGTVKANGKGGYTFTPVSNK